MIDDKNISYKTEFKKYISVVKSVGGKIVIC